MDDRDLRAVLGLPLDATRGEARRAFRRLAKQTHPDAGGNGADFRAVAEAWAQLAPALPADPPAASGPAPGAPAGPPPHVAAYRAAASRVIWAESRPVRRPVRRPDFASVLRQEMARRAA